MVGLPAAILGEPWRSEVIVRRKDALRPMTDIDEEELARQIDRDVAAKGGLVALVLCLCVAGGLLIAGAVALFPQG